MHDDPDPKPIAGEAPDAVVPRDVPDAEAAYLAAVVETLRQELNRRLVGVYLFGSAGYGAYEPGRSDLDVQAVTTESLASAEKMELARRLAHRALPCPARQLELVGYARAAVDPASRHPRFELNFNTGRAIEDHLMLDPAEESSHWFLLDIAFGRELGVALLGPPPAEVFAPVPRVWCLETLADSLAWHAENEPASVNAVLNACRGWRYAATGVFGSKRAGAAWALAQPGCPVVVAEASRAGAGDDAVDAPEAVGLVDIVAATVRDALTRERNDPDPLDSGRSMA